MVKTEKAINRPEPTPPMAWAVGAAAWFVPGAGHLLNKRWLRAVLMGGAVWTCFFLGMGMGGHMFNLSTGQGSSVLLQVPPMIANVGSGALYVFLLVTRHWLCR